MEKRHHVKIPEWGAGKCIGRTHQRAVRRGYFVSAVQIVRLSYYLELFPATSNYVYFSLVDHSERVGGSTACAYSDLQAGASRAVSGAIRNSQQFVGSTPERLVHCSRMLSLL